MIFHERSQYCEIRFKLFLTLLHMKMGVSYATMLQFFGWGKSCIAEWCQLIRIIISKALVRYRTLLTSLGADWQYEQLKAWKLEHLEDGNYHHFKERVRFLNDYERRRRNPPTIDSTSFIVYHTYSMIVFSLTPSVSSRYSGSRTHNNR